MSKRSENLEFYGVLLFIVMTLFYGGIVFGDGQHFVNPADVLFKWFFGISKPGYLS